MYGSPKPKSTPIVDRQTIINQRAVLIGKCARLCHEVNRTYCSTLGDVSQVPWDQAPEWQRTSAIKGVMFCAEQGTHFPERQHNSWMKEKLENGWKYGHKKDEHEKTHPCLIPYEYLPADQKLKDSLFGAICNAFFAQNPLPYLETAL